jgi:hypothetical protein
MDQLVLIEKQFNFEQTSLEFGYSIFNPGQLKC